MKKIHFFGTIPLIALAVSCGSGGEEKPAPNLDLEITEEINSKEEAEQEVSIVFPSAVEIMTVFQVAGLDYKENITLPITLSESFNTRSEKAFAAGFYTADLAYCVITEKPAESQDYLKALISVSEELGIPAIPDPKQIVNDFEEALGNENKTLDVLESIQIETDSYIENNDMQDLATVVFAGAWVEAMYLAIESNADYNYESLSKRMVEQMFILENILVSMEQSEALTDKNYIGFKEELKGLNDEFKNLESVQTAGKDSLPDLSLEELSLLASRLKEIRQAHA